MEVRKQVLPKKLIWKEEEREQEEKQNREKAVQPLALGAMNGAAKGVAAARQWQMVNRSDKPKAAIPKAVEPVVQPVKVQKKAAPQPNPMSAYDPLVKIAKSLPTISPAHQLAQKPIYNNRDGANLYNALSRQLDSQAMDTINGYYARLAGDKLRSRGVKNPSGALTAGLAQAWMGRRPEGEMRKAVLNYPHSGAVLEDLLAMRPGLGNMAREDLERMISDQYRQTLDDALSPEDRARAMNRLGIYEKEALVNRGMTQEELEKIKAAAPERMLLSANEKQTAPEEILLKDKADKTQPEKSGNAVEGKKPSYSETLTQPDPDVSPNGKDMYLGYVFPLKKTDSKHRYGGAEADEKMPLWYFMGAIHQSVDGEWKYNNSMAYRQVDCIGVARLCAQQYYKNKDAMYKNVKGTVSEIVANCIGEMKVIDLNNLEEIPVGAVLFRESKAGHMGYYIGEFNGIKHCIAETNGGVMHYDSLENRYRKNKNKGFFYWAPLDCVDYSTPHYAEKRPEANVKAEPGEEWLVVDDEPQALPAWEEWKNNSL